MLSPLRNRFGIPGVISVIALVFAMLGGAYAASNDTGSGKASASAKRGKPGKPGKPGPVGPAGPQGSAGPAGAKGDTGAAGSNGANGKDGTSGKDGKNGTNGKSVEIGTPTVGECDKGGATVQVAGEAATKKAVCNGQTGFTKTLPPGETETGAWSIAASTAGTLNMFADAGFSIPLAEASAEGDAFGFNKEQTDKKEFGTSGCTGSAAEPTAPAGKMCVYTFFENLENTAVTFEIEPRSFEGGFGAYGVSGAFLAGPFIEGTPAAPARVEAYGTWAVTAPTS